MRQIVLDTETTGLEPSQGHRIIEIGAIEIIARKFAEKPFHHYVNPQRAIDEGAKAVHGITEEFLADKPVFSAISQAFIDYVRGAELIIHNAPFDVAFLNAELARLGEQKLEKIVGKITDSLQMARSRFPGKKNTLDALCERLDVDNTSRTFHGAALDAQLLGDVYLGMTRGQESLEISSNAMNANADGPKYKRPDQLLVKYANAAELDAHQRFRATIDKSSGNKTVWSKWAVLPTP